jgi:hypothetical protein
MSNVRPHSYFADCPRQPQTIGVAFNDSPIGILMWIGEKYNEECDPDLQGNPEHLDAILTTCSLYFLTACTMTSMLCHYNNVRPEDWATFNLQGEKFLECPFGYSSFKFDDEPTSGRAGARPGNLKFNKGTSSWLTMRNKFVERASD